MKNTIWQSLLWLWCFLPLDGVTRENEISLKELRQNVIAAQDPDSARDAYDRLFTHVGEQGLTCLTQDCHTGIALQAAWERSLQAVPVKQVYPDLSDLQLSDVVESPITILVGLLAGLPHSRRHNFEIKDTTTDAGYDPLPVVGFDLISHQLVLVPCCFLE